MRWTHVLVVLAIGCSRDRDSEEATEVGPCAGGEWGAIIDPAAALHVRADGSDDGDGSRNAPFASIDAALTATRSGGGRSIALGPGEYPAWLSLSSASGDDALAIEGCGSGEVVLTPADTTYGASFPVVEVDEANDVRLAGFTIRGGRRSLLAQAGATLVVDDVQVVAPTRTGIVFDGNDTFADVTDVEVHDVVPEEGIGYGIAVQLGRLAMTGGGVWNATGVGILAHFAQVDLSGVTVDGTAAADGRLGRGIQLQSLSQGSVAGSDITDNHDAGVFARETLLLDLVGNRVSGTSPVTLDGGAETGDGIVLIRGDPDSGVDPATFVANLQDNVVSGCTRAGVLVADVTASLDGNTAGDDNGLATSGTSLFAQGAAAVGGADAVNVLDDPLEVDWVQLAPDDLLE